MPATSEREVLVPMLSGVVEFGLARGTLIGRAPGCTLRLADPRVSREHARLDYVSVQLANGEVAGRWELRDLASTSGTWWNGQRIASGRTYPLVDGDVVRFGGPEAPRWRLVGDGPPVHPDDDPAALTLPAGGPPGIALVFTVTEDDDLREVRLIVDERAVVLERRAFTPVLYALARARAADRGDDEAAGETGWVKVEELPRRARVAERNLSVHTTRVKDQLAEAFAALEIAPAPELIADRRIVDVDEEEVWERRLTGCTVRIVHA